MEMILWYLFMCRQTLLIPRLWRSLFWTI